MSTLIEKKKKKSIGSLTPFKSNQNIVFPKYNYDLRDGFKHIWCISFHCSYYPLTNEFKLTPEFLALSLAAFANSLAFWHNKMIQTFLVFKWKIVLREHILFTKSPQCYWVDLCSLFFANNRTKLYVAL